LIDLCLPIVGVELSYSAARISATYKAVSLGVMATWWPLMMSVMSVRIVGNEEAVQLG